MGVFDRFFRRKGEDATVEVASEDVTAEAEAEATGSETAAEPAEAEAPVAEAVEIPKQQSAEAAADSGAGESART
ncbi:gliding motility protein [Streptomyces sp. NBC_00597]|nr:gliding motility protein [Streptomyces sp. NBC_01205]